MKRHKWIMLGRFSYYFILLSYCLFLASLTTFILSSPNPLKHPEFYDCSEYFANQTARPLHRPDIDTEVLIENTDVHFWSKVGVLFMFVMYCGRFVLEEIPLVIMKALIHSAPTNPDFPWSSLLELSVYSMSLYVVIEDFNGHSYFGMEIDGDLQKVLNVEMEQSLILFNKWSPFQCSVWQVSAALITVAWINLLIHLR